MRAERFQQGAYSVGLVVFTRLVSRNLKELCRDAGQFSVAYKRHCWIRPPSNPRKKSQVAMFQQQHLMLQPNREATTQLYFALSSRY